MVNIAIILDCFKGKLIFHSPFSLLAGAPLEIEKKATAKAQIKTTFMLLHQRQLLTKMLQNIPIASDCVLHIHTLARYFRCKFIDLMIGHVRTV